MTERETAAAPESHLVVPAQRAAQAGADQILAAYTETLRRPITSRAQSLIHSAALELLADGFPVWWLCDRAQEMAPRGWTDLIKHSERSTVPAERQAREIEWCGECDKHSRKRYTDTYEYVDCGACSPLALAGAR